ncbi:putative AMSH/STAMBP protein ubiquitin specific-protease [Microsporum ferrugineum]
MSRPALDRSNSLHQQLKHRPYLPLDDPKQGHGKVYSHPSRSSRRSLAAIAIQKTSSAFNLYSSKPAPQQQHHQPPAPKPKPKPHPQPPPQQQNKHIQSPPLEEEEEQDIIQEDPFRDPDSWESDDRPADATSLDAAPGIMNQSASKMHQTSSRLLRMTTDERPFTRDFKDLFSTLMVSLKLETHRVRFSKFEHTFTAEEAINNLGSLKFSQSNRMPDPKDPTRIVTTTTTFSMAKEMARSVCQRFVDARFIESVDGRFSSQFPLKGALYQLTPKGINILHRFCQRNGITARHIMDIIDSPRNTMQLVIMERDSITDQISNDKGTIEVIFRRFAGQDGPNLKPSVSSSDSDSLSDYTNGVIGVKMARERKIGDKLYHNTFTGKAAMEWLMDCCTTIDRRETMEIASLFVRQGLITSFIEDKTFIAHDPSATLFQPTKNAIYGITDHGQRVCGWLARERTQNSSTSSANSASNAAAAPRDSNNARLHHIIQDPALRLLFREFLRYSLCEENMSFYLDVSEFTANYRRAEKAGAFSKMDTVRETLASAYGLYNAFLAPGSPCELNIDHALRNSLASRMTRAVGDDASMVKSLTDVVQLFEAAQLSVFKLMSSVGLPISNPHQDSVPKFARDPKYAAVLQEHDFDLNPTTSGRSYSPTLLPERSMSRSTRS